MSLHKCNYIITWKPVKPANPDPVIYSEPNNIEGALGVYNIINTNGAMGITKNKISTIG